MKFISTITFTFLILLVFTSCKNKYSELPDGLYANIETSRGSIIIALEYNKTPITVANFASLAEGKNPFVTDSLKGKPFYDGLKFHRVISTSNGDEQDFMIQGGDPKGDGSGGPGYKFSDEIIPELKHDKPGVLSMANAGPGTNGSQFFITLTETPWLDGKHTVFGKVVSGQDIVTSTLKDDVIKKVSIIAIGSDAKKFNAVKTFKDYYEVEAKAQQEIDEKARQVSINKRILFEQLKLEGTKTNSGIIYELTNNETGKKPKFGTAVLVNYSGYYINGDLFDTSIDSVAESYNKLNPNKAAAGAYKPFTFDYGQKQGLIPGFIETLELMSYKDKMRVYIPAKMAWGEQGYGDIPPNTDVVFEIELLEKKTN